MSRSTKLASAKRRFLSLDYASTNQESIDEKRVVVENQTDRRGLLGDRKKGRKNKKKERDGYNAEDERVSE